MLSPFCLKIENSLKYHSHPGATKKLHKNHIHKEKYKSVIFSSYTDDAPKIFLAIKLLSIDYLA